MIERLAGEIPTFETRAEANEKVDREKRYKQILKCLYVHGYDGLTAKQIAVWMQNKGYIPTSERNFVAPRLTELCKKGLVEQHGKTRCEYTGRTVTVYWLPEEAYDGRA